MSIIALKLIKPPSEKDNSPDLDQLSETESKDSKLLSRSDQTKVLKKQKTISPQLKVPDSPSSSEMLS